MPGRSPHGTLAAALLAALAVAAPALAAPPPNDVADTAVSFDPYVAENGIPREQQGIAELYEATPDAGVPRCLGSSSFERTVWFRVPEVQQPQILSVEASGRTLEVVDLAAFVQTEVPPPAQPPPPPPPQPEPTPEPTVTPGPTARASQALTREPNACFGLGAGGSDAAEEPTSALTLQVPARHPVLIQVGRRGAPSSPDDDRAILSLDQEPVVDLGRPPGDRADQAPLASVKRTSYVELAGATITEEDPAQPPCPSLGTVWRRINPGSSGRRLISAGGVGTLTVFAGRRPTGDNVLDCVNRERSGALQMVVPVKRRRPLWIRLGTDRPVDGAEASLRISAGRGVSVIDGGPGGSDPTPGGPGGGFPFACDRARPSAPASPDRRCGGAPARATPTGACRSPSG